MSTLSAVPVRKKSALEIRHRIWIALGSLAAATVCTAVAIRGEAYYRLPSAARTATPLHAQFKPSGSVGHLLGIAGITLLALMYVYALRKRWPWLARKGKTKRWLDYHILMGLTAPVLITLHSSFKFQGIAGLAYWIMMAVVASGIVGRYLYGHIPRRLDAAEMTLGEMQQEVERLRHEIHEQQVISAGELKPLLELPPGEQVQKMPLMLALVALARLDIRRWWVLRRMRRSAAGQIVNSAELNRVLEIVRDQAALSRDILFLSKMRKLFHLWHVIHRPFSYSFAVLAILHVVVVIVLGYY